MKIQLLSASLLTIFLLSCKDDGLVLIKDEKGNILQKYEILADSTVHGTYEKFYQDGNLQETATYENGQLVGDRVLYYRSGQIESIEPYIAGRINGDYKLYYENGQLQLTMNYVDDMIQGISKKYYENGKLEEQVSFQDSEENGPFKEYYENGEIHWEGTYLNGDNEFGELKEYDETGQLLKRMMCDSLAICRTVWTAKDGDIVPKY